MGIDQVIQLQVQILEKMSHSSENPVNTRLHWRLRELCLIKEFGTAVPYGCNDQIKGVGTLSSPHTKILMSWVFLTNDNDEREIMDNGITTKNLLS